MKEFNTRQVMEEIHEGIAEVKPCMSDLHFTTSYYRKLIRMLKEPEKLVVFGAGKYGRIVLAALKREGINTVQCFCDNDGKVIGKFINGLEVFSPKDAMERYTGACFVVTPKDYENEILRQLICMNVSVENIVLFNIKNTGLVVDI